MDYRFDTEIESEHNSLLSRVAGTLLSERGTALLGSIGLTTLVGSAGVGFWLMFSSTTAAPAAVEHTQVAQVSEAVPKRPEFPRVEVQGESAVILDLYDNTILFSKNAEKQLPLASLTKLMTALVALEVLGPEGEVTITADALQSEGDSGLILGERWELAELLKFSLVTSSNDGARAIAASAGSAINSAGSATAHRAVFVDRMNETAHELGLAQTYFVNETGLDMSPTAAGAYGSAHDAALLLGAVLARAPGILEATSLPEHTYQSRSGNLHYAANTNISARETEGLIASKTGFTDLAGGNLGIVVNHGLNHPFAIVVLGSSREERFTDVEALHESLIQYLESS